MENKGFTLIEVIAIMVVLVGIFLVSFPVFTNMAKTEENNKYNNLVNDLCIAGKTYMYANMDEFPELSIIGNEIEIRIEELIMYGNVDKNTLNPETNTSVEKATIKYIVLDDLSLKCEYIEE